MPIAANTSNTLQAVALYEGAVSPPATAQVTQDPNASPPAQITCNNETPYDAGMACDNPQNAVCAYACNNCTDDAYTPNQNPTDAPALSPGTYNLQICPCDPDWFALVAPDFGFIDAQLQTGADVQMTIDLLLPPGVDGGGTVLASATTQNGSAELTFLSGTAALYDLTIFAAPDGGGSYQLTLNDFTMPIDAGVVPDGGLDAGTGVDGGPSVYGPCSQSEPGLDPAECNSLTPYCDINPCDAGSSAECRFDQCVAGPADTQGEACTEDPQCNFQILGTQVVCSNQSDTCIVGACHSDSDCPTSTPTCNMTSFTCQ